MPTGAKNCTTASRTPRRLDNLLFGDSISQSDRAVADRLAAWLPKGDKPLAPGSANRILERREDGFYWEGKRIDPAARIE